jgi:DNA polymerase-3 subunit alpha
VVFFDLMGDILPNSSEKFVHLHVHTHYSLLDGMGKIPDYLDKAKSLGMNSMAITDHGVMYGAIEFYKEAKKRDLRPIIGCECYVAPRSLHDKEPKLDAKPYHLVLLAKNNAGYQNLLKLVSIAHIDGYYYKPRIDKKILRELSEGLIAMSACLNGEPSRNILADNYEKAKAAALEYEEIFGKGNYYLELQDQPGIEDQEKANKGLKKISKETGIGLVVTNDVHYANKDDSEAQDALLCVQMGKMVADEDRMKMTMDNSMRTYEELLAAFPDVPEAFENTVKIAEMCNVEIELGGILIPDYPVPEGHTVQTYLHELVNAGIGRRYKIRIPELEERLKYELGVIDKMGYEGYFLIVQDYVNWAKDQGIVVGPGRGSAAGSVVAYALGIVDLEPMQYDLLFERFLNPDRISMPDVDMDFADDRRHEVIKYVTEKYGQDRVAQIITFGTMAARNAIRDVGRVLGISYGEVDKIAKAIPEKCNIKQAMEESKEFKSFYHEDPRYAKLIDLASKLEGVARHSSTHAAGVVISKDPLVNYTPLQKATKGDLATNTQYEMHAIEDLGLLKMDFLGLSNLTILKNAMRIAKKVYGKDILLEEIPIDDKKTFHLLSRAETTGVFQLESAGMKRYIKELKPSVFEDIIAMVALYRPGPMENIPEFIDRKHGRKPIKYEHPRMEAALKNTYGITVYQEQVMQISKDLAGFTGGQADTLRKAIGKKIASLLSQMRGEFVKGAKETSGVPEELGNKIFDGWEAFAAYAFNKSHAACYALIAYWTAYLKAHFPDAFMAALLTSDYGNMDRIAIEIAECQRMKIQVLPPDVNESFGEFAIIKDENKIRFGLMAVKNVGLGPIEGIIKARDEGGKFTSIEDFVKRVPSTYVNKKVMESLAKCGAFDSLCDRGLILENMERILSFASKSQGNSDNGQIDLFGGTGVEMPPLKLDPPVHKITTKEKLNWEKELLGIYISEHPINEYREQLIKMNIAPITDLNEEMNDQIVKVGGIVSTIQKIQTRTRQTMMFIGFEDYSGKTELIVFPKLIDETASLWEVGKALLVKGKVSTKDSQIKLIVEKAVILEGNMNEESLSVADPLMTQTVQLDNTGQVNIYIPRGTSTEALNDVKYKLAANKGETPVMVYVPNGPSGPKKVKLPFGINYTEKLADSIRKRLYQN